MIIKMTVKDNYCTQIIEKYFDEGSVFVDTYYNSKQDYEQLKKEAKRLYNCKFGYSEKKEIKTNLESIIRQNFINYLNNIDENSKWHTEIFTAKKLIQYRKNIIKNLEVKLVDLIVDRPKNKEVVYYIDFISQYITL